jgi:hypothetical protein
LSDLGSAFVGGEGRRRSFWRKRVGVEPTKDRLTAPPGFEVRTPHRGRFSSNSFHIKYLVHVVDANKRERKAAWTQVGPKGVLDQSADSGVASSGLPWAIYVWRHQSHNFLQATFRSALKP